MLHLIQSNKMNRLVGALSANIAKPVANVLVPRTVLVQSPGMAQWLNIRLAEHLSISANIAFPLPSSFIWNLYKTHIPQVADESAFTKENMTWKLMALLPNLILEPAFSVLNEYLVDRDSSGSISNQPDQANQIKLYQLASKIADVFDQYLVYRADWIDAWENEQRVFDKKHKASAYEAWQAPLWQALVTYTIELGESPEHRASLHAQLIEKLSGQTTDSEQALHVFGISAMPEQQLEVLKAYSQSHEVFIYWLNPCEHYWADLVTEEQQIKLALAVNEGRLPESATEYVEVGHPLLSAWGALGRNYQDQLLNYVDTQQDQFVSSSPSTLLGMIQASILSLDLASSDLASSSQRLSSSDRSMQFHICHSKLREVEVLHDQILGFLEARSDLAPKDIIVMMPNITDYIPFIDGVFGAKHHNERALTYAISDKSLKDDKSIVEGFSQLLTMHLSRVTVQDVSHLLHIPAIMAKFDLSLADLDVIATWLDEVQVKWGLSGQHKTQLGLPDYVNHTWLYGLLRLLTGYAIKAPAHDLIMPARSQANGISPYDYVEGQQSVALGKLYQFVSLLAHQLGRFTEAVSLVEKERQVLGLIDGFFEPDDESLWVVSDLKEQVQALTLHQHQYANDVEHSVYVSALMERIEEKGVGQRFLAGAINFCTLMPMRSIPFKVVCLLGMNDNDYPRYVEPMSFDLVHQTKARKGDRSRRQDDRYLFLEALVCATETFYVSYVGKSAKDNSVLNPSIVLSELMDYCDTLFEAEGFKADLLTTTHPLHPYHTSYYSDSSIPTSFASQWLQVAKSKYAASSRRPFWQSVPSSADLPEQLEMTTLCRFFANPCAGFFKAKWQTRLMLSTGHDALEPMSLNGLSRYYLIDELNTVEQSQGTGSDVMDYLSANGRLPLGEIGQIGLTNSQALAYQYLSECRALPDKSVRTEVNLLIENIHLVGWTDEVKGQELVLTRPGRLRAKDKIELWLWWLALCAHPRPTQSQMLTQARFIGLQETFVIPVIDKTDALTWLNAYVSAYADGQHNPLPFFPEAGLVWLKTQDPQRALNVFYGDENRVGEGQELHAARLFGDFTEQFEYFIDVTNRLLRPLVDACGGKL